MAKLREVSRHVRSKNAGPFWVTVDIFFADRKAFDDYHDHPALSGERFSKLFGSDPAMLRRTPVEALNVLKISYPRPRAQGWAGERDMHSGQQYVRLMEIELD